MQRHPEVRWLFSVAVVVTVGVVVGSSLSGAFHDQSSLPATSPTALLASIEGPHVGGYSGTITSQVELGLPTALRAAVVATLPVGGRLLDSRTHSMQYWYGSAERQRVALRTSTTEEDVFRDGTKLLTWNTETRVSQTSTVAAAASVLPSSAAMPMSLTPPQLADALVDLAGADSETSLRSGGMVANRPTYELELRPYDVATSRVTSVHIQIDGVELVPLGVQVYARGSDDPAVNVFFSSISFEAPAERNFTFTPPAAAADEVAPSALPAMPAPQALPALQAMQAVQALSSSAVRLRGTGWNSVATTKVSVSQARVLTRLLGCTRTAVTGSWGRGSLLSTPLFGVLVTSKGAVAAGAVAPSVLYSAVE